MTVYYIYVCHISQKTALLCCRKLSSVVLMTYLQALVSVAQAQLPAGHHGLLGAPVLSTDQTPALCPVRVCAQHLYTTLVAGTSACDSDLCGAKVLAITMQSIDTHGPGWITTQFYVIVTIKIFTVHMFQTWFIVGKTIIKLMILCEIIDRVTS